MPVFRFNRTFRVTRNVRLGFDLTCGLVRDQLPTNKRSANQDIKSARSPQHVLLKRKLLENKRLELQRTKNEIPNMKSIPERRKSKKVLIETQQEIFQLQDELYALEDLNDPEKCRSLLQSESKAEVGTLPDFVVIGAQKCGTSTFYDSLTLHPHVEPAASKELHYFDDHFDEGTEWYRRCFPLSRWRDGHKMITGEATPAYMFRPGVPERMTKYVPEAKLIALLRNPVDRAYSHYHQQVRLNAEDLDFEAAVRRELEKLENKDDGENEEDYRKGTLHRKESSYLSRGIYADQLLRWLGFFDREQILVMRSEAFFQDMPRSLKRATDFLGLSDWEVPDRKPRNKGDYTQMNSKTRQWLTDYFEPHNQRLYELLHEDFGW